ncbi:MAG: hypothetical protein IJK60_08205, partial [Clostridia bacterium]|nr:hypothetical protein [Clostridia bacterium]
MKNAKRIISVLLSALLMLSTVAVGGTLASADDCLEVEDWQGLYNALQEGGNIILTADIVPDDPYWADALVVPDGIIAQLDLNGHIVDRGYRDNSTEIWDGSVIKVEGILTVIDSNPTADHGGAADYIDPLSGETVSVTGGILTGGWPDQYGGIYVGNGTFIMHGGTICGNRVGKESTWGGDGIGAGVYIQNGMFEMDGGAICYNRAVGKSTIMGATMGRGGGVYVANGTFNMIGGTITGNEAGQYGGGVYFASAYSGHDDTVFSIGNDAQITGNAFDGAANNVYIEEGGKINIIASLTGKVGVTMMTPGVFTSDLSGKGTQGNFTSDDINYTVSLTDSGEAQLVERPAGTIIDIPEGIEEEYKNTEYTGVASGEGYILSGTVKATDAGEYTATATLNDGYVWSDGTYEAKEISWKITPRLIWFASGARLDNDTFTYDGTAKEPKLVFLKDSYLLEELEEGVDYEIIHEEWKNNVNASDPEEEDIEKWPTAVISVEGKGNYKDSQDMFLTFEILKADPEVTAPEAVEGLKADGTPKELVTAGQTTGGTLEYSLDGEDYSEDIPTAADEGSYTVYYRVTGDENYNDAAAQTVSAAIGENIHTVTYIVDGEEFAKFDVDFGQSVPKPRTPQKDGYTFKWIDEIPETMPAEDVT